MWSLKIWGNFSTHFQTWRRNGKIARSHKLLSRKYRLLYLCCAQKNLIQYNLLVKRAMSIKLWVKGIGTLLFTMWFLSLCSSSLCIDSLFVYLSLFWVRVPDAFMWRRLSMQRPRWPWAASSQTLPSTMTSFAQILTLCAKGQLALQYFTLNFICFWPPYLL